MVNNAGSVSILLGKGDGSFGPHQDFTVGSFPIGEAAGDFNQDGKMDLAVVNWDGGGSDSVSVLLGNGDGTFQTRVQYQTGIGPYGIIAADVNVDGNCVDLVVTNPRPGNPRAKAARFPFSSATATAHSTSIAIFQQASARFSSRGPFCPRSEARLGGY